MNIKVKNSQLNNETMQSLNTLIELDINASAAFKLTRIIKELSSIVDDKIKMEKKILDKWVEKDENGSPIKPKDSAGNIIQEAVSIINMNQFQKDMQDLLLVENSINQEKLNFEDLNLSSAKVKDLIKLDFLFN